MRQFWIGFVIVLFLTGCETIPPALKITSSPRANVYAIPAEESGQSEKERMLGKTPIFVPVKISNTDDKVPFKVYIPEIPDIILIQEADSKMNKLHFDLKAEYLANREIDEFMKGKIERGELVEGMSKEQVLIIWGSPSVIEKEGIGKEKWIYGYKDYYSFKPSHYFYFEDEKLTSWREEGIRSTK